jgi:hypothetical protein
MLYDHPYCPTHLRTALAETAPIQSTFLPEDTSFVLAIQFIEDGSSSWEYFAFNSNDDLYASPNYDDQPDSILHFKLDSNSEADEDSVEFSL